MPREPLSPAALCPDVGAELSFDTTAELDELDAPLGQARALEALRLAISLDHQDGYNAFVMGPPSSGKRALVLRMLERAGADAPTPSEWCYLNDLSDPRRPRAIELPPGRAPELRRDLDRLGDELRVAIPAAFESADYRSRLQLLEKDLEETRDRAIEEVRSLAQARGIALIRTPMGFGLAPVKDGEVVDPEEFRKLPEEVRTRVQHDIVELQEKLGETLRAMPDLERRHRERVKDLNREVALYAAGHLLEELRRRYADLPQVLAHLDAVQRDVVENVHEFVAGAEVDGDATAQMRKMLAQAPARRYGANVMVEHGGRSGAPVVEEDLPSLANLVGRIEHQAHFGTLVTDFSMLRPGALHRANGGYLVLDARRLLLQPFAWDELKRALRSRLIRIEPPERLLGFATTATLEPQPIPLHVKVVLVGDRLLYHLLARFDPEFPRLFKIEADFEDDVARSPEADRDFARLVATVARRGGLRPFDRGAVQRMLRDAARRCGDGTRLSSEVGPVEDLAREAEQRAAAAGRDRVTSADVQSALEAQERRAGRVRDRIQEEIRRGTLVVETAGERVGQVNGLSVLEIGRRPFGRPSRITARVRLGKGDVVDIEREVELGGPIHSKGVLILGGYLGARYCGSAPLTLAATLVFEQSYGGVEGDSASSAELYALLSAIAGVPVRQSLAVTGSVDQLGRVQAVGGVTEKIEGFFDVCRARGLTGAQGVLVPASNVPHLVLRDDVVAAAAERRFHVWAVETIDEGIALLTGMEAGTAGPDGRFPAGSFNARVQERLEALAQRARAFAAPPREEGLPRV